MTNKILGIERSFIAAPFIKTLDTAIGNNKIKDQLIIHSDRGSQFNSKLYVEYINNHKYFIGSQTAGAPSWENPVIERMFRTFKSLLKELKIYLPSNVKTTRYLQFLVEQRREKMNNEALYAKNNGLIVNETIKQLSESDVVEPEIIYAREGTHFLETVAAEEIKQYKKDVRFAKLSKRIEDSDQLDKMQLTNITTQHMVEAQGLQIKAIGEKVNKVLERVTPKKRTTNKALIMRDPVPKSMLERILKASRPKGIHQLTWARFQVTSTILFFTGLRIGEVAPVTEEMLEEIVEQGTMTFYQPKVNKYRTIRFTSYGVETIKRVFLKNIKIIFDHNKALYPLPESSKNNIEKFTGIMNKLLSLFNDDKSKKISSHSFRVAFVSNALKHTSAHNTQKLIGHADIRSTMKYSRYELDPEEEQEILKQMFE